MDQRTLCEAAHHRDPNTVSGIPAEHKKGLSKQQLLGHFIPLMCNSVLQFLTTK